MSGKGSTRRPGTMPAGAWETIFTNADASGKCPRCSENVERCVCCPTEDGPGQEDRPPYERRKHNREGV